MSTGVAVVGLCFGRSFLPLYRDHPGSSLVAVCDKNEELLQQTAREYPGVKAATDLAELLAWPEVEAIHVCTPAPLHTEQSLAVMQSGRHVMCAVPAALTEEDCRRLIEVQQETGVVYMMAETGAYYPGTLYTEELLASGKMGELVHAESDYVHDLGGLTFTPDGLPAWRWGYPPMWYPTHCLGPIVKVSGQRVVEVVCFGGGQIPPGYQEPYGNPYSIETALFRFSAGLTAKVGIGFADVSCYPNELFRFYGTKMSLFAHESPRCDVLTQGAQAECVQLPDYKQRLPEESRVDSGHHGSHPHLVHEWISSIQQGRSPAVDVREAVAYTLPGLYAHQSALAGGRPLSVPLLD